MTFVPLGSPATRLCPLCRRPRRSNVPSEAATQVAAEFCKAGGTAVIGYDDAECFRIALDLANARTGEGATAEGPITAIVTTGPN